MRKSYYLNTRQLASLLLLLLTSFSLYAQPTTGGSRVVNTIQTNRSDECKLEQRVLAADGSIQRVSLMLPKRYILAASAHTEARNLYLLRKQESDSCALLLTDSLGRIVRLTRLLLAGAYSANSPPPPPQLVSLPASRGFVLLVPTKKTCRMLFLTPDLATRWTRELPVHPIQQALASNTHLCIIQVEALARDISLPLVHAYNLATGESTYDAALQPTDLLEAVTLVPEGLLLLGTSNIEYARPLPAGQQLPQADRVDFLQIIKPNGQLHLAQVLLWPGGKQPHFHWQGAYPWPSGGYQLIGQTFKQVPNAAAFALTAVGVALLAGTGTGFIAIGNYVNEQPSGLILAKLLPSGRRADVHTLTIPETLPATVPAVDTTAAPPRRSAAFSPVGLSPDHRFLVLSTDRQVLLYEPARHAFRPLVATRPARPTVLALEPGRALVGWAWQPDRTLPDFEWVAWP